MRFELLQSRTFQFLDECCILRCSNFLKRGESYKLLLTYHLYLEAFCTLGVFGISYKSTYDQDLERPEIRHLFLFHVQINTCFIFLDSFSVQHLQ